MCQAKTLKGTTCKRKAVAGSPFCRQHAGTVKKAAAQRTKKAAVGNPSMMSALFRTDADMFAQIDRDVARLRQGFSVTPLLGKAASHPDYPAAEREFRAQRLLQYQTTRTGAFAGITRPFLANKVGPILRKVLQETIAGAAKGNQVMPR